MAKVVTVEFKADTKSFVKDVDKAEDSVDGLNESVNETDESMEDLGGTSNKVLSGVDKLTGGAISKFTGWIQSIKGATKGMNILKVAIASTGIGALLIALGSLTTFFTKTQRGADKIGKVFAGLGAITDVLIDRLSSFGEGLFLIFSGDFAAGVDKLKGSLSGISDEMVAEAMAASNLEEANQKLLDSEIALITVNAKRRQEISALRLAAEDETKSTQERFDALNKAAAIQNEMTDEEIELAKERLRIKKEQNALGESTRDDVREEAELEATLISLETQRTESLKRLITRQNAFRKEIEATNEAERIAVLIAEETTVELAQKDADLNDLIVTNAEDTQRKLMGINQVTALDYEETTKKKVAFDKAAADASVNIAASLFSNLKGLAEEGSVAAKAFAVAEATINVYKGITAALGAAPPPFNFVLAGATAAAGFLSVRKILSTKTDGSGGASAASGGGSVSASSVSTPSPNIAVQAAGGADMQLAKAIRSQSSRPVRSYVVSQDVTTQQSLDRRIGTEAVFGG